MDTDRCRSFLGQIPLIIFCTLVAVYGLPASLNQTEDKDKQPSGKPRRSRLREIDFAGVITLSAAVILLLFVLQTLGTREEDQLVPAWGLVVAFVVSSMAFVLTEVFYATRPLVPMHLLIRELGAYCLMQCLLFSGRTAVCILTQTLPSTILTVLVRQQRCPLFHPCRRRK